MMITRPLKRLGNRLGQFLRDESGPTTVEYAALVGVISAGALAALSGFGDGVYAIYAAIDGALSTADPV
jgi:Flp pilus assembly pilin Flp